MKQTILIIGGAGYIGSHTAYHLHKQGYTVIVLDALLHGQTFAHAWATFIYGNYGDAQLLHSIFEQYSIDAVMHFAAHIEVGESVKQPLKFYANNVANTITLLEVMQVHGCNRIIFSSSCAVYGNPVYTPIDELHPCNPISPYGKTKLMVENILHDCMQAYGLQYVALRYFNAAGASHEQNLYEQHVPETHLIPLLCTAAYTQKPFFIFGTQHSTADGSCVRDFLHVKDIADAHLKALLYLQQGNTSDSFNLGTGQGISVKQMVTIVEQLSGLSIVQKQASARLGDPAILVANASRAHQLLSWRPYCSDIITIITDALGREHITDLQDNPPVSHLMG